MLLLLHAIFFHKAEWPRNNDCWVMKPHEFQWSFRPVKESCVLAAHLQFYNAVFEFKFSNEVSRTSKYENYFTSPGKWRPLSVQWGLVGVPLF